MRAHGRIHARVARCLRARARTLRGRKEKWPHTLRHLEIHQEALDALNPQGETPLVRAALAHDVGAAGELIRAGADVNLQTPSGRSPLIVAAEAGHLDLVKLLVENGAKIDAMNKIQATPLFAAANSGRADVVEYLLARNADPNLNRQGLPL
jgi:ankyrin repeat protein